MTQQHHHRPQYDYNTIPPNPHIENDIPRIAHERYKPEYRDEPKQSETLTEWIFPIAGWFVVGINGIICFAVTKDIITDKYNWANHFSSVACFMMTLFALVITYKYREIVYNVRAKQDVRRDD